MQRLSAELRQRFPFHEWQPVTIGVSSAEVWYLRGEPNYFVKLGARPSDPDSGLDVLSEAERLQWLVRQGIPAPTVLDAGESGKAAWMVTSAVAGRSVAQPWPAERRGAVVDAFADAARSLHALSIADCPFDRRLDVTTAYARRSVGTSVDLLDAARPDHEDLVVCHGDLCVPNILLDPDTLELAGVVDVGRLGVADRYADLALAARSLSSQELNPQYGPGAATRFLSRYGEDPPDEAKITFYCLLDEF